ncbi:Bone morphoproteintic protein 1 [Sparganum proliferum]
MQGQAEIEPPSKKLADAPGATVEAPRRRSRRGATASKLHLWRHGVIPYIIDRALYPSPPTIKRILKAMRVWENGTCVSFVEKERKHRTYINFTIQACGCCSFIGLKCSGSPQTVSLAPSCATEGMVLHQLGHVLGFYHEQSRPDRDDYVEIFDENIREEFLIDYEKKDEAIIDSLGEPYDYESIMHYDGSSHAKPGRNETMRPKKCCHQIGQWVKLSPGDIRQANKLYKCPSCGQTLMEYTGTFASPQSESLPPTADSNANTTASSSGSLFCQWRIIGNRGEHIRLNFTHIDMSSTTNQLHDDTQSGAISQDNSKQCEEEYVEVRDGYYSESPLIGRYCGKSLPPTLVSLSSRMLIEYKRPSGQSSTGFVANYKKVPCRKYFKAEKGTIMSPGYPNPYPPSSECTWNIEVPDGDTVTLTFHSFELESHEDCSNDYLAIYDGPSTSSDLLKRLCGSTTPEPIKSTGNTMTLHFITDKVINKEGFAAQFSKAQLAVLGRGGTFTTADAAPPEFIAASESVLQLTQTSKETED